VSQILTLAGGVEAALLERDRELRRSHRIVGALSLPLSMFTRQWEKTLMKPPLT
jgi:hypothetical protein